MTEKVFESRKTARYFINDESQAQTAFIILHGYGQLPEYFSRKFSFIKDQLLIFPEGPHRFYLNGASGRVGASWMTKEAREHDIADNLVSLDRLYDEVSNNYPQVKTFHVLGFSQGAATAARWMANSTKAKLGHLIMWCALMPDDVKPGITLKNPVMFVYASQDQYLSAEDARNHIQNVEKSVQVTSFCFEGGHDIHTATVEKVMAVLQNIS